MRSALPRFLGLVFFLGLSSRAEVGFYKGTFDPPHEGHLRTLRLGREEGKLKKVYVIPNFDTSHKPGATDFETRWELTRSAIRGLPGVELPPKEILLGFAGRKDPMAALREWIAERNPGEPLFSVMGADSYRALGSPDRLLKGNPPSRILVVDRPDQGIRPERLPEGVTWIPVPGEGIPLSSSMIRSNVFYHARHLPEAVFREILERGLYDTTSHPEIPPRFRELLFHEQARMVLDGGDPRVLARDTNEQDTRFRPETRDVFSLKSYWVGEDAFEKFEAKGLPREIRSLFVRRKGGKLQYRLLVHPESEAFYGSMIQGAERGEDFRATPTASPRSLVVWRVGQPDKPLLVKVSLDREVGEAVRTIRGSEIARSIGHNELLSLNRDVLPADFRYFPEQLGFAPKGGDRGGMLIRTLPDGFGEKGTLVVPLFSLYSPPRDGSPPLLAWMIRRSGKAPDEFLREYVTRPFLRLYLDLAIDFGLSIEAHGQNVLIEIGPDGLPTKRFFFRDLGGMNIDLAFWKARGLGLPELPAVESLFRDYHQKHSHDYSSLGLDTYFSGNVLWDLDRRLPTWVEKGWIPPGKVGRRRLQKQLVSDVEAYLADKAGMKADFGGTLEKLHLRVHTARRKLHGFVRGECRHTFREI